MEEEKHYATYYGLLTTSSLLACFFLWGFFDELHFLITQRDDVIKKAYIKESRPLTDSHNAYYIIAVENSPETIEAELVVKAGLSAGDSVHVGFDLSNMKDIRIVELEPDHRSNMIAISCVVGVDLVILTLLIIFKDEALLLDPTILFRSS